MSSYKDAELMMATQVAYLNYSGNGRNSNENVGDLVESILKNYGTYDSSTGQYTLKAGVSGEAKAQFNTAQNIWNLSEQNNSVSWRQWKIVDSYNQEQGSGYYGCLIDTGDGNAIVGCRGSESYNVDQTIKDWGYADLGRVDNVCTDQQADATKYMKYLYKKYGKQYESFSMTGHSLGGGLATHSAITAPEGMQEKIDRVVSFDGPGFSDEYLKTHQKEIRRIKDKLEHFEWSWVGALLNQPDGIKDTVIKAHDDETKINIASKFFRHATENVEFDKDGNVIPSGRGNLQQYMGPLSKIFENCNNPLVRMMDVRIMIWVLSQIAIIKLFEDLTNTLENIVDKVQEKVRELYNGYISLAVSGNYEIRTGEIMALTDDLDSVQGRLNQIADEVNMIRRDLPYDSLSAFYYKNCLRQVADGIVSEGKKSKKLARTAETAVGKYNQGDQRVQALF